MAIDSSIDPNGILYGTTAGYGTEFSLTPN
jgi:hypothetical protein